MRGTRLDVRLLLREDERDPGAVTAGAPGPPDAVDVGCVLRRVVVDDVGDAVEVHAAGGDVGRDERVAPCRTGSAERPLALAASCRRGSRCVDAACLSFSRAGRRRASCARTRARAAVVLEQLDERARLGRGRPRRLCVDRAALAPAASSASMRAGVLGVRRARACRPCRRAWRRRTSSGARAAAWRRSG